MNIKRIKREDTILTAIDFQEKRLPAMFKADETEAAATRLAEGLKVMDSTAVGLLVDSDVDVRVFNMNDPENAVRAVKGEDIGTLVSNK